MFILTQEIIDRAGVEVARVLSACRVADFKGTYHRQPCTEDEPCRGCTLDAAAAVAACLLSTQECLLV